MGPVIQQGIYLPPSHVFSVFQGEYTTGVWEEKGDEVLFADFKFTLKHHYFVQDSGEKEEKDDEVEGTVHINVYSVY